MGPTRRLGSAAAVVGGLLLWAAPAEASIPSSLADAGSCTTNSTAPLAYVFCNDGTPAAGGTDANQPPNTAAKGEKAITVPAKYGGDGFTGLPASTGTLTDPGADTDGNVALDVDVTLPTSTPPGGGYPLIFMMHGCCSGNKGSWEATGFGTDGAATGERWHYNNAWFASRGYVVVNYTARGFVSGAPANDGSTGEAQLDSRNFEINDYQHLACQVFANASDWNARTGQSVSIDPTKVVTTGGSYGGGFSWMALTDPKWTCTSDTGTTQAMSLAAVAPKYGWTDLVHSLTPTGTHFQDANRPQPQTNGCDSGPRTTTGSICTAPVDHVTPAGMPKRSINAGLYASGKTGVPPGTPHTTFPAKIDEAQTCLTQAYPGENNPLCASTLATTLPEFLKERSAYYQNDWFGHVQANDPGYKIPIFNAATFSDPLFPPVENRRMANRILSIDPSYPIQQYFGDYNHFVQNKAKEWGDLCGADHHVCTNADYPNAGGGQAPGDFNGDPGSLLPDPAGRGVTTRLNRFIDNYTEPASNPTPPDPNFDVTASLQVCPDNAGGLSQAANEAGPRFNTASGADSRKFETLAPNLLTIDMPGMQTTTAYANSPHSLSSDPVQNSLAQTNGGKCPVETGPAGGGVASYQSNPLPSDQTMVGATTLSIDYSASVPSGLQLNARLYDAFPNNRAVMVDRGVRRVTAAEGGSGTLIYQLHSNGWRFQAGHRVRIEIAQDDDPYVHRSDTPGSAPVTFLSRAKLEVPVREPSSAVAGGPGGNEPPSSSSTGSGTSSSTKNASAKVASAKSKAGSSSVSVTIECEAGGADCDDGTVSLESTKRFLFPLAAKRKARKVSLGKGNFSIKAGQKKTVKVKLTRKGRKLVRKKGKVKARAKVTTRSGGSSATTERNVTVSGKKKKRR